MSCHCEERSDEAIRATSYPGFTDCFPRIKYGVAMTNGMSPLRRQGSTRLTVVILGLDPRIQTPTSPLDSSLRWNDKVDVKVMK